MTDFKIENNPKDATKFNESLSSIMNIIKSLEKEYKNDFSVYFKEGTIIDSIFSLLNFLLSIIQQLTDLIEKQDVTNINNNIIENLLSFTKELLSQKIKQIIFISKNNNIHDYNINGYQDSKNNYNIDAFNNCNTLQKTQDNFFQENFDPNLSNNTFFRSKSNKTVLQQNVVSSLNNSNSKKIKNIENQRLFLISEKNNSNIKNENPITKVKNIIKKAKNHSSSVDNNINNSCLMNKSKIFKKLKKLSQNKKENNLHSNSNLTNRKNNSDYFICPSKSPKKGKKLFNDSYRSTISVNIFQEGKEKEEREAKEILYDCMNNMKKKLGYNEKEKKKNININLKSNDFHNCLLNTLNCQSRKNLIPCTNKK